MATKYYIFKGKTKWCKVRDFQKDPEYDNYQVPLYMTDESWEDFRKSGLRLVPKKDDDGTFVTFKRKHSEFNNFRKEEQINGPPKVFLLKDGEYVPYDEGHVGNGSEITVKVEVYDTKKGAGHRLVSIGVDSLVEYNPDGVESNVPKMPF
jgi:hypothetical protein